MEVEVYEDETFYIDLEELPGPIVRTQEELFEALKNINKKKYTKEYKKFNKKYNYLDDGKCAKRVVETFLSKNTKQRSA